MTQEISVFIIHTYSIPGNHLHHRSDRSSGPCAGVSAAHRCQGNDHHKTCKVGVLCDWYLPGHRALCDVPVPCGYTIYAHGRRSGRRKNVLRTMTQQNCHRCYSYWASFIDICVIVCHIFAYQGAYEQSKNSRHLIHEMCDPI